MAELIEYRVLEGNHGECGYLKQEDGRIHLTVTGLRALEASYSLFYIKSGKITYVSQAFHSTNGILDCDIPVSVPLKNTMITALALIESGILAVSEVGANLSRLRVLLWQYATAQKENKAHLSDTTQKALPNETEATEKAFVHNGSKRVDDTVKTIIENTAVGQNESDSIEKQSKAFAQTQIAESKSDVCYLRAHSSNSSVDCLPQVSWRGEAAPLKDYFDYYPATNTFSAPHWRYVRVPTDKGSFCDLGRKIEQDAVTEISYAIPVHDQYTAVPQGCTRTQSRQGRAYVLLKRKI